jgi:hypothetical protein
MFATPDDAYLRKIGLFVFAVAELEGMLVYDLVRLRDRLPPDMDLFGPEGGKVTGKTTIKLGEHFTKAAPKISDPVIAEYYRVGGEALLNIGPRRNALLHSHPGLDSVGPDANLRLMRMRWQRGGDHELHLISDEWLDLTLELIAALRAQVEAVRPPWDYLPDNFGPDYTWPERLD